MRIGSLFSGYGGLEQGVQFVLGGTVAWHSEVDPGACKIIAHRYPDVPNLGDITTVDWSQAESVDVLTGGFPCQDVSCAGLRKGLRPDTRSGLWTQMAYAIDQLRPALVVAENVRGLLSAEAHSDLEPCPWCVGDGGGVPLRALGAVLGDLADLGYDASWQGLRASDVGAPHGRFRVFVVAWPTTDANGEHGRAVWRNGWAEPGRGGCPSPHPAHDGRERGRPPRVGRDGSPNHGDTAADADRDGFGGLEELHGIPGSERKAVIEWDDTDGLAVVAGGLEWGAYTAAIRRWELLTRPAPNPTERGKNGQPRLSPRFVEWMQGLAAGWVTDVPGLSRNEQLKALGNGVVPQQAAHALRLLLSAETRAAA